MFHAQIFKFLHIKIKMKKKKQIKLSCIEIFKNNDADIDSRIFWLIRI